MCLINGEKGFIFLTEEFQLIDAEGLREIKNCNCHNCCTKGKERQGDMAEGHLGTVYTVLVSLL